MQADEESAAEIGDERVEKDMTFLLKLRDAVLGCLEQARTAKDLRSSLEAQIDIFVPSKEWLHQDSEAASIIRRHRELPFCPSDVEKLKQHPEGFLKTLFIVSDVSIVTPCAGAHTSKWLYTAEAELPGMNLIGSTDLIVINGPMGSGAEGLRIRARPSALEKCPRCWTYTRSTDEDLCPRCAEVHGV